MRLIIFDTHPTSRRSFYPLVVSRPIYDLRCGMTTLAEKLIKKAGAVDVAFFAPEYLCESLRQRGDRRINDPAALHGPDLLLLNARLKPEALEKIDRRGPSVCGHDEHGEMMFAWIRHADQLLVNADSVESMLESARCNLPSPMIDLPAWRYAWELVLHNTELITADFAAAGRHGVEGVIQQPFVHLGRPQDLYIAPGATVQPMVVVESTKGPVYIDEGAEIQPFTRIEGPCYIGRKSILLGAKCREGMTIGPMCRIGGEVEESIIQGYSNKYHDGFLGHAFVGEWVNLGALTTNSDLKNDYGNVEVTLDGHRPINTGSMKVGALIGDHVKTSIGTLFNTGSYVGAMSLIMATGKPLPKHIPEFSWLLDGVVTKGFGKAKLYETAKAAMGRRGVKWTAVDEAMWDQVYATTSEPRDEAIRRGRRQWAKAS